MFNLNIVILCVSLGILALLPNPVSAGEYNEWFQAAVAIVLRHEAGHYISGNGGDVATASTPIALPTSAYSNNSLILTITPGGIGALPTGPGAVSGGASTGFVMSGAQGVGLGYTLNYRAQPTPQSYPGALKNNEGGKTVWRLPQHSLVQYHLDYNLWSRDVKRKESSVAGAGFLAQQAAIENNDLPVRIHKKALVLSGVFQSGYVAYHYIHRQNTGDISRMAFATPEPLIVGSLLISAVSDLLRGSMDKPSQYRLAFNSDPRTGAVGLIFSGVY